jgi:hypothetical protein
LTNFKKCAHSAQTRTPPTKPDCTGPQPPRLDENHYQNRYRTRSENQYEKGTRVPTHPEVPQSRPNTRMNVGRNILGCFEMSGWGWTVSMSVGGYVWWFVSGVA